MKYLNRDEDTNICLSRYWSSNSQDKVIIHYVFSGITQDTCNLYNFQTATSSINSAQKDLILKVFDYISSVFEINFKEVESPSLVDMYVGQVLDKYSETNIIEWKYREDSLFKKVNLGLNGFNINSSKIRHYPQYSFAHVLQSLVKILGFSTNLLSDSNSSSVRRLPQQALMDEEHYTNFSDLDILILSSRYKLKQNFQQSNNIKDTFITRENSYLIEKKNYDLLLNGTESEISNLIKERFNVNKRFRHGSYSICYPLGEAVIFKNNEAIRAMIKENVKVNLMRASTYNVFADSCNVKDGDSSGMERVKMLLEAGGDPNFYTCNEYSGTALIRAVKANNIALVTLLLDNGAELNAKDFFGHTALYNAAICGGNEIAQLLFEHGSEIDLVSALFLGLEDKIELYFFNHTIEEKQKTLSDILRKVIHENNIILIKRILDTGFLIEDSAFFELLEIQYLNIDIVKLFLEKGANIKVKDIHGNTALHISAKRENAELMEFLLHQGINPDSKNEEGYTALHLTLINSPRYGDIRRKINLLINYGADISLKDKKRNSVFHLLAQNNNSLEYFELFVNRGVDINEVNDAKLSMLDIAMVNEIDSYVIEIFKQGGGELNFSKDSRFFYYNYIESGIECDQMQYVPNLLIAGAKPSLLALLMLKMHQEALEYITKENDPKIMHLTDHRYNNTPLHYAARDGCLELVILLIKRGANLNAVNNENKTALDFAESTNNRLLGYNAVIVRHLKLHGAVKGESNIVRIQKIKRSMVIDQISKNVIDIKTKDIISRARAERFLDSI